MGRKTDMDRVKRLLATYRQLDPGLTVSAAEMLMEVARNADDPPSVRDLAHSIGVTIGGASRILKQLEEGGRYEKGGLLLVERVPDPEDARYKRVILTARGRRTVELLCDAVTDLPRN